MSSRRIVIGIPTYRRPKSLRRLLDSISALRNEDAQVTVLVADNDVGTQGGIQVVVDLSAADYPFKLIAFAVPERGLASVRNALLEKGFDGLGADFVAMIDDDERVEADWLAALLEMQADTNADVVFGAIFAEFERTPPKWTRGQSIYWGNRYEAGPAEVVPGSGSILLSRRIHQDFRARFDDRFSLMGGEDSEFFARIGSMGATFAHAPSAVSHEFVGVSRMTRNWALQRAFRIGCTDMHVLRLHGLSSWGWCKTLLKLVAASAGAVVTMGGGLVDERIRMKGALLLARQFGKVAGGIGRSPAFYAVTHGE